jgi:uncharacterized coiled-coil protein SlyX
VKHSLEQSQIDLEMKVGFLELAVEKLQKAVLDQATALDQQDKLIKRLQSHIGGLVRGEDAVGPAGEKPPHY